MAYWWVSQNQTWRQELEGGYLWAPKLGVDGRSLHHWETMTRVQEGDIVFSYVNQAIGAVAIAKGTAYDAKRPSDYRKDLPWEQNGRRIDVVYQLLKDKLRIADVVDKLVPLLPDKYSPIKEAKSGNQGYLYSLPARAGRFLLEAVGIYDVPSSDDALQVSIARLPKEKTEREALVQSRIGQGQFREDVLRVWSETCAASGATLCRLLRASHIKPWRDSNDAERLDPYNGLLLTPGYDAAFDAGFISFAVDGQIILSYQIDLNNLKAFGINPGAQLRFVNDRHQQYLRHHREQVLL